MQSQNYLVHDCRKKWKRSPDGYIAGVCEGLGQSFQINPNLLRVIWLLTILLWGTGIALYLLLAFSLPREDRKEDFQSKKILGVCLRLSQRWSIEVGLIRFLTLVSLISSFGLTLFVYIILHFVLNDERKVLF